MDCTPRSMLAILLVLKLSVIWSSAEIPHFLYSVRPAVSLSGSSYSFVGTSSVVRFKMLCGTVCGRHSRCMSFYAQPIPGDPNGKLNCQLLSEHLSDSDFNPGPGVYGYLKRFELKDNAIAPAPAISPTVSVSLARTRHGTVAVYDCSSVNSKMTNVGLLYSHATSQWSDLNEACKASLCNQLSLAGTLLEITQSGSHYEVQAICSDSETHVSDAQCDSGGTWSLAVGPPLEVLCVPTLCFRLNVNGKGVYKGTNDISKLNIPCQSWEMQSPQVHYQTPEYFPEDDYNRPLAENHCRDPDTEGTPWCYNMFGNGTPWALCDIPTCRLEYSTREFD